MSIHRTIPGILRFACLAAYGGSLIAAPEPSAGSDAEPIAIAAFLSTPGVQSSGDHGLTPPNDMPAFYRTECGSCHVPYPPNLLSAGGSLSGQGWLTIMGDLRNHYGEDATLEEPLRRRIEQFLVDHAAKSNRRFGGRSDPPRLTNTLWFHRNHGEAKPHFKNERVRSPANCQACHPRAEEWRYAKEELVAPKPPRR